MKRAIGLCGLLILGLTQLSIAADDAECAGLRASARTWMEANGLGRDAREDVLLVISELFSNAVNAVKAVSGTDAIEVHLHAASAGGLEVTVTNTGSAFDLDRVPAPTIDRRGGRGLAIAQAIGSVQVRHTEGRTTVAVAIA